MDSRDRILLRPLKSLGKPKNEIADISFLRRTQYVAEDRTRIEGGGRAATGRIKRRKLDISKEDPTHILRSTIKGFDVANPESTYTGPDNVSNVRGLSASLAETEAWKHPKHPSNPHLKMVDSYPLIPDLSGFTEDAQTGGYVVLKFVGNPTGITDRYDPRLEASFLHSVAGDPEAFAEYVEKLEAHKSNPEKFPVPIPPTSNFELFHPEEEAVVKSIKRKRDTQDPEKDTDSFYTDPREEGSLEKNCFKIPKKRQYESGVQQFFQDDPYQEVAVALHDPEDEADPLRKAAYFYPIAMKTQLKPRRVGKMKQMGPSHQQELDREQEQKVDAVAVWWRDMNEEELEQVAGVVERLDTRAEEVDGA